MAKSGLDTTGATPEAATLAGLRGVVRSPESISNIQVLRGFAALAVVLLHIAPLISGLWGEATLNVSWGAAGVDVFFIISGFIMVHTNQDCSRTPIRFWIDRIIRIVPLYWAITFLMVAILMAGFSPSGLHRIDAGDLFTSLFFIPDVRADGVPEPILSLGWTLNYEMFFYLVFGLTLLARSMLFSVGALAVLFGGLAAAGHFLPGLVPDTHAGRFYTDPIMLEFVAGAGLALAFARGWLRGWFAAPITGHAMVLLGVAGILATEFLPGGAMSAWENRVLWYGVPALFIVSGALVLHETGRSWRGALPLALGAASYSIYLLHPVVIHSVGRVVSAIGRHPTVAGWLDAIPGGQQPYYWATVIVVSCMAAACCSGYLLYRFAETPVNRALKRRFGGKRRPGQAVDAPEQVRATA